MAGQRAGCAAATIRGTHTLTSAIFDRILELVARGEVVISDHGYDELAADGIPAIS
jgi:phage replication-related protein YjqB (UPF0714/DUF867 family)